MLEGFLDIAFNTTSPTDEAMYNDSCPSSQQLGNRSVRSDLECGRNKTEWSASEIHWLK